jgi:2-methylcitrate dehydratase PrpD
MTPTSEVVAEFVTSCRLSDIPTDALHQGRRTVLNYFGLAIDGAGHEASTAARALAKADGFDVGECTVLGVGTTFPAMGATLLNGLAAHVEDFDDTHLATFIHAGAPILPAVLAAAESKKVDPAQALLAGILGVEVAFRFGLAFMPGHWERGYHLTSTCGVIGAAVGAGVCLGLSAHEMVVAMGLASAQASGVLSMLGTSGKALHAGRAAQSGWLAAELAGRGYTSGDIEGPMSYSEALSPSWDASKIIDDLGQHWEIVYNTYKPYACGIVAHPAIDAAISIRERHRPELDQISSIELRAHPSVARVMGNAEPRTSLEGKFSVQHSIAVGLLDGIGGVPEFSDARVGSTDAAAVRKMVRIVDDNALRKDEAVLTVELSSGELISEHVTSARGSASSPLSDDELEDKVSRLVEPVVGASQARGLISALWQFEDTDSVSTIMDFTRPEL